MTSEKKTAVFGPWMVTTGIDNSPADDWEMPVHQERTSSTCQAITDDGGEVVAFAVTSYNNWDNPIKEARLSSNARLIAEAGTVFHECGMSPRELLEGYRELRKQLDELYDECGGYMPDTRKSVWRDASAALAKHKEV